MKHSSLNYLSVATLLAAALTSNTVQNARAQGRPVSLPPQASEIAKGVFDLGLASEADGTVVQGLAFVHYKEASARPDNLAGPRPPNANACYEFFGARANWKVQEPYVFDANESGALDRLTGIEIAISTWEDAAGKPILGEGSLGEVRADQLYTLNEQNEVMFGYLSEPGVIAVTIVWGVFGGPPAGRHLAEWDMVFGNDWGWWFDVAPPPEIPTAMDFLSIATHEIGHAIGLDHPSARCTEETMYAYAAWNEIKKRDLNGGDILGIRKLYP